MQIRRLDGTGKAYKRKRRSAMLGFFFLSESINFSSLTVIGVIIITFFVTFFRSANALEKFRVATL